MFCIGGLGRCLKVFGVQEGVSNFNNLEDGGSDAAIPSGWLGANGYLQYLNWCSLYGLPHAIRVWCIYHYLPTFG